MTPSTHPFGQRPKGRQRADAQRGFTLIELLTTIAVAAVLLMVAVPSMTAFNRNSELTAQTNNLLAAINATRGEALKRGMNAVVTPADGTNWNSGIVAFVDTDRSGNYNASTDITIMKLAPMPSYFTLTGGPNTDTVTATSPYIMFNPSGYAVTRANSVGVGGASTLELARNDLSGSELLQQTRRLMVAASGRVRSCKPDSATDVKCSMASP